jgi:flagellar hook-associated protein 3 FlgL
VRADDYGLEHDFQLSHFRNHERLIMRIATSTFQNDAVSQMDALEAALSQTQQQLSTGLKVQNAADDPVGMTTANQLNVEVSASTQYVTNSNSAQTNLQLEEQALSNASNIMQNANTLAVEANQSSLTSAQRQNIATELQQDLNQLVTIGNSTASDGSYLFGGVASSSAPFAQSNNNVTYNGSTEVNQVQISENQSISAGDSGATAFMNVPTGNGTFVTSAAASNTGSASISTGEVTQPNQWVPGNYTISFTDPTDYTITDNSSGATVASGTYSDGNTISFNGAQLTISGTPATGDTFSIAPAGTTSAFSALSNLFTTLTSTSLNNGQLGTQIGSAIQQINNTITNFSNVSASVGSRLNAITAAQSTASTNQTTMQTNISSITNVDYAAATTALSSEELALQAAQESYASLEKMSLFQYLQ